MKPNDKIKIIFYFCKDFSDILNHYGFETADALFESLLIYR